MLELSFEIIPQIKFAMDDSIHWAIERGQGDRKPYWPEIERKFREAGL